MLAEGPDGLDRPASLRTAPLPADSPLAAAWAAAALATHLPSGSARDHRTGSRQRGDDEPHNGERDDRQPLTPCRRVVAPARRYFPTSADASRGSIAQTTRFGAHWFSSPGCGCPFLLAPAESSPQLCQRRLRPAGHVHLAVVHAQFAAVERRTALCDCVTADCAHPAGPRSAPNLAPCRRPARRWSRWTTCRRWTGWVRQCGSLAAVDLLYHPHIDQPGDLLIGVIGQDRLMDGASVRLVLRRAGRPRRAPAATRCPVRAVPAGQRHPARAGRPAARGR